MSTPASNVQSDTSQLLDVYKQEEDNEQTQIKQNDKDIGALQSQLNDERKAIKKMPDGANIPEPSTKPGSKFQLEDAPDKPKLEPDNPQHVAWAAAIMFLMGSLIGGGSLFGMEALAQGLRGYQAGRKDKADADMADWKAKMDTVVQHNSMVHQQYEDAWTAAKGNWDIFQGKAAAIANTYHDDIMLQTLKDKKPEMVGKLLEVREKALMLKNTDLAKLQENAWNHKITQTRTQLDSLGRQQTQLQSELDHNDSRIGQLQSERSNALIYAKDDDERKQVSDSYQKQIDDLDKRGQDIQKRIDSTAGEYGKYQQQLDQYMSVDDGAEASASLPDDVKGKALEYAKAQKMKAGDTFQVKTDSGTIGVKYTGTDVVPVTP